MENFFWIKKNIECWLKIKNENSNDIIDFISILIKEINTEKQTVEIESKFNTNYKINKIVKFEELEEKFNQLEFKIYDDISEITILNEAEIFNQIKMKYEMDDIYFFCGPTLIAINPYKTVKKLKNDELKSNYIEYCKNFELDFKLLNPHIWSISVIAYRNLIENQNNQAICISGESGAGKTESARWALDLITSINKKRKSVIEKPIEDLIMSCNPILEIFGNSKTEKNDNSSRFGKYTEIGINSNSQKIIGARIKSYLLEKSRVTHFTKFERNYHIFYCFLENFSEKEKYFIDGFQFKDFNYLNQSNIFKVETIDDNEFFSSWLMSLKILNFKQDYINTIWKIISSILFLGNLEIDSTDYIEGKIPCKLVKNKYLKKLINLLEIDTEIFEKNINYNEKNINKEIIKIILKPEQIKNKINCLAKNLYDRLFLFLIKKMNNELNKNSKKFSTSIGLLDIFGFEIFESNSLEQLFINYTNEKLQNIYIKYVFENECEIFKNESLEEYIKNIKYKTNEPLLNLISINKICILNILDSNCSLNKNDNNLLSEYNSLKYDETYYVKNKFNKNKFLLKHSVRDVEYTIDGFIEKNKDEISLSLTNIINNSNKFISKIFFTKEKENKSNKEKFLSYKFRKQIEKLNDKLNKCQIQFIRCLKPNEEKRSNYWVSSLAILQIKYMGILDSIKIKKQSYPFRFDYDIFWNNYKEIDNSGHKLKNFDDIKNNLKEIIKENFLKNLDFDYENLILLGKTKIFLNNEGKNKLDEILNLKLKNKKKQISSIYNLYNFYRNINCYNNFMNKINKVKLNSKIILSKWMVKIDYSLFKIKLKSIKIIQIKYRYLKKKKFIKKIMKNLYDWEHFYKNNIIKNQIINYNDKNNKSFLIQSTYKKFLNKKIIKNIINLILDNFNKIIIEKDVIKIQSHIRKFIINKKNKDIYNHLKFFKINLIKGKKIIIIQKNIKSILLRKRFEKIIYSIKTIQRLFKGLIMKKYFKLIRKSTKIIQNKFKRYLFKKKFIKEHNENLNLNYNIINENNNIKFKQKYPKNKENIEIYNKFNLLTIIGDIQVVGNINYKKWLKNFKNLSNYINNEILDIEINDNSTYILSTNLNLYNWNLNDNVDEKNKNNDLIKNNPFSKIKLKNLYINNEKNISLDYNNNVYIWNNKKMNIIKSNDSNFFIKSKNNLLLIYLKNKIYEYDANMLNKKEINLSKKIIISNISFGLDFYLLLSNQGKIFGKGKNNRGQLGNGNLKNIEILKEININNKNNKIIEISTGFQFSLIRNSKNEVYGWGYNYNNPLNLNNLIQSRPKLIKNNVQGISCGSYHSYFIINDEIYKWDKGILKNLIKLNENLIPIKIATTWSKNLSILKIVNLETSDSEFNFSVKNKFKELLRNKWIINKDESILNSFTTF